MKIRNAANTAGILLLVGSVASALSRWYLVWLAQKLEGPEILGVYGMLFAIATPLFVAAQLGLRTVFLSKSTAYPWRSYILLRAIGLTGGSGLLILIIFLTPTIPFYLGLGVLAIKIFDGISDLYLAKIQYSNKLLKLGLISFVASLLAFLFSTLGALTTQSLTFAVGGAAIASLLSTLWAMSEAHRIPYHEETNESGTADIFRSSFSVTSADLLASLLLYLPVFYLSSTGDLRAVGIFVGVSYALTAADLVGSTVAKVLITPLRNTFKVAGPLAAIGRSNSISAKALAWNAPAAVVFILIGDVFFQWVYGPEFQLSPLVLGFFALAGVSIVVSHLQAVCLNVLNHYNRVAVSFGVACAVAALTGAVLLSLGFDALIAGSAMAAAGSVGRTATMFLGVQKARVNDKSNQVR